jgi:hypothetical protein
LQDLVIDRIVVRIPFQYIAAFIVILDECVQGVADNGGTIILLAAGVAWV